MYNIQGMQYSKYALTVCMPYYKNIIVQYVTFNICHIVAMIGPPTCTTNSARNYLVPRMEKKYKYFYKFNT